MLFRTSLLAVSSLFLAYPSFSAVSIVGSANISVTVDPAGTYTVNVPEQSWVFGGNTGFH